MMKELGNKLKKKNIKELQDKMPELPEYHCVCDNCGFSWYDDEDYNIQTGCPNCSSSEVYVFNKEDDNY